MRSRRLIHLTSIASELGQYSVETRKLAIAITATEMVFRPLHHRLAEYVYALALIILGRNAGKISVGISQISIRHYVMIRFTTQLHALFLSTSAKENISTCCELIQTMKCRSINDACRSYNGNCTKFYTLAAQRNHTLLQKLNHSAPKT